MKDIIYLIWHLVYFANPYLAKPSDHMASFDHEMTQHCFTAMPDAIWCGHPCIAVFKGSCNLSLHVWDSLPPPSETFLVSVGWNKMTWDKKLQNKRQPYSPHPHIIVQFNVTNPLYSLKMRGIKTVTLCHWNVFPFCCVIWRSCWPREQAAQREGVLVNYGRQLDCFSFYNGAEPNKET